MKIKILTGLNIKKLEFRVNAFIKDKCIIKINHELRVFKICNRYVNYIVIVILYDEYDHCGYLDASSIMEFKDSKYN